MFLYCGWQKYKINVNIQTSMIHSLETSEDRPYHVKTKMPRFGYLFRCNYKFFSFREKNSIFKFVYKQ